RTRCGLAARAPGDWGRARRRPGYGHSRRGRPGPGPYPGRRRGPGGGGGGASGPGRCPGEEGVLARGGVAGGGIETYRDGTLVETVLGLPIDGFAHRTEFLAADFFGSHRLAPGAARGTP